MQTNVDFGISPTSSEDFGQVIVAMTQLFLQGIDQLAYSKVSDRTTGMECRGNHWPFPDRDADASKTAPADAHRKTSELGRRAVLNVVYRNEQHTSIRWFLRNLSREYNNLLMGIMGNITLAGMACRGDRQLAAKIMYIERLIISAANLTHLLFGYLSERRIPAKKLQLAQLLSAIEKAVIDDHCLYVFEGIKKCMHAIDPVHDKLTAAAGMAGMMEQLLIWIQERWYELSSGLARGKVDHERSQLIGQLIESGFRMVRRLQYYSGKQKIEKKRVSLKTVIRQQLNTLEEGSGRIEVSSRLPKHLPWIFADRKQIELALQALIDNAVGSMTGEGRLHIGAKRLHDEKPSERCAVHNGIEYVVITIKDTGHGMDRYTQARIFDPFFKKQPCNDNHVGLGLSAACGIVKSHGGYIQVRSISGKGSVFKIYLPAADGAMHQAKVRELDQMKTAA
jgi:signal transduction histidine kinase